MFGGDKSEKELQEEFAPYYNSFSFFYDLGALAAYVKASFNDGPILAGYNGGGGFGIGLKVLMSITLHRFKTLQKSLYPQHLI